MERHCAGQFERLVIVLSQEEDGLGRALGNFPQGLLALVARSLTSSVEPESDVSHGRGRLPAPPRRDMLVRLCITMVVTTCAILAGSVTTTAAESPQYPLPG